MRVLLCSALLVASCPAFAQGIAWTPTFATQLRYEQLAADKMLGTNDAMMLSARPGVSIASDDWSLLAESDASLAVRRAQNALAADATARRPEAMQLNQLRLNYKGIRGADLSFGRQRLGLADAALTGDRDGEQTFDAARVKLTALPGVTADFAYAWASRSLWARTDGGMLPETVGGANLFARIDWTNPVGTLSGYAYQVDQRRAAASDFRLLNQVYGARFSGNRNLGQSLKLAYSVGYTRQTGSLANAAGGAPTYWQMGSALDLADLSGTQTSFRKFAANGIALRNGDEISLATSLTAGKVTVGARYSDFRATDAALPASNLNLSLGMVF